MGILKTLTVNGVQYSVTPIVPADSVTLLASAWVGEGDMCSQVVEVPGVTAHTKVDLQPTAEQLAEFHYKVLAFVAENDNGVITVYSIGDKPTGDHTIQITKTEVEGTGRIRGNTVGTTTPRPDWNQTDPTKADYILNKPDEGPAIVCEASGSNISLNDSANRLLKGLNLYGKTTRSGTPTADTEAILTTAGTGGSIRAAVTGKNLFGGDALADALVAKVGATKNETAGTVQYSASSVTGKQIFKAPDRNKQYTIILYGKNTTNTTPRTNLSWYYSDKTSDVFNFKTAGELSYCVATSKAGKQVVGLYGYNSSSSTILYYDKCGIFEGVLTETDFESYIGSSLTVSTPTGLPGIPVTSGGNYTDENGQRWVCDEIDFARGVRITRLAELVFDGVSNGKRIYSTDPSQLEASKTSLYAYMNYGYINPPALSSTTVYANYSGVSLSTAISITRSKTWLGLPQGEALTTNQVVEAYNTKLKELYDGGTPVRVLYQLKTPTETPLSAEELAAYAAMHTNKPNTTVYNDAGAGMKIGYVADTKAYIDKKFNELATALVNNT